MIKLILTLTFLIYSIGLIAQPGSPDANGTITPGPPDWVTGTVPGDGELKLQLNYLDDRIDLAGVQDYDTMYTVGDTILYIEIDGGVYASDTLSGVARLADLFPADNTFLLQPSGETTRSTVTTFMGFREDGDSIIFTGEGAALVKGNRLVRSHAVAAGNQAVVEGYMSVALGTNTISGANDATASGNESMTGHRLYLTSLLSTGYDTANYIIIDGDAITGGSGQQLRAIGDQSDYFFTAVDSGVRSWDERVFWDYPMFWTNVATRDYPAGSAQRIGITPLRCTGVEYDAVNNETKVWYADSVLTFGTSGWITDCRKNSLIGTGHLASGKYASTIGEAAHALGFNVSTNGIAAMATGYDTYAGANGAFSSGVGTQATGLYSAAFNRSTRAVGNYSVAFGEESVAENRGSFALGRWSKTSQNYDLAFASDTFSQVGDAQGVKSIDNIESPALGPYVAGYAIIDEHTAYTGSAVVTAAQTTHRPGRIGEAGSWILNWGFSVDDKYVIDSVNTTLDRLYFHGDSLFYDDHLAYNAYTDSTMDTNGTPIGGLSPGYNLYIVDGDSVSWMSVSTSQGGAVRDLTTEQETQYHVMYRYYVHDDVLTLIGASFANDGDDVGNHTTTGIRPIMHHIISYHQIRYYVYGLADRNIRWVFNTDATIINTE